jgi:hypothetical protein
VPRKKIIVTESQLLNERAVVLHTKRQTDKQLDKQLDLTLAEQVAQQALEVSEVAIRHSQSLSQLQTADLHTEQQAVEFREVIKQGISQAHEAYDDIVKTAKTNYDTAKGKLNDALEPFEKADRLILDSLNDYYTLLKRLQREEEARAEKEQAERERLAAILRQQERQQLEADIERQLAELPDHERENEELIQKIIAPLEDLQDHTPVAPPVRVSKPVTTGAMSQQSNWTGEVTDMYVFLQRIVNKDLPVTLIEVRQPELNKLAAVYQDKIGIPGVRFYNKTFVRGTPKR